MREYKNAPRKEERKMMLGGKRREFFNIEVTQIQQVFILKENVNPCKIHLIVNITVDRQKDEKKEREYDVYQ